MERSRPFLMNWLAPFLCCIFLAHSLPGETVRASIQPPEAREKAPDFHLPNASEQLVRLSDYRGKVVALNFWATECGGCRLEIPSFVEIDNAYKSRGVAVVGVSMDVWFENLKNSKEGWSRVNPFVSTHGIKYTMLMGDNPVKLLYHIEELPVTLLIDANGRIAATYVGIVDKGNLEGNIDSLLMKR